MRPEPIVQCDIIFLRIQLILHWLRRRRVYVPDNQRHRDIREDESTHDGQRHFHHGGDVNVIGLVTAFQRFGRNR